MFITCIESLGYLRSGQSLDHGLETLLRNLIDDAFRDLSADQLRCDEDRHRPDPARTG